MVTQGFGVRYKHSFLFSFKPIDSVGLAYRFVEFNLGLHMCCVLALILVDTGDGNERAVSYKTLCPFQVSQVCSSHSRCGSQHSTDNN